jgi:hypothetical protein
MSANADGDPAQGPLVEEPALEVARQQPLERQDRGEQRGDPHDPAAGSPQQLGRGADRERVEHRHREEEQHRQQCPAAPPAGQQQREVAAQDRAERTHAA